MPIADVAGADVNWAAPVLWTAAALVAGLVTAVAVLRGVGKREPKPQDDAELSELPKYPNR